MQCDVTTHINAMCCLWLCRCLTPPPSTEASNRDALQLVFKLSLHSVCCRLKLRHAILQKFSSWLWIISVAADDPSLHLLSFRGPFTKNWPKSYLVLWTLFQTPFLRSILNLTILSSSYNSFCRISIFTCRKGNTLQNKLYTYFNIWECCSSYAIYFR